MDVTIQTSDYVYILELKVDQSAETALRQIEEKHYAAPFATDPRTLFKIGVCFSSEEQGIKEWKVIHSVKENGLLAFKYKDLSLTRIP